MKKIISWVLLISLLCFSSVVYGERIYISRLSDENIHMTQFDTGTYSETNCGPTSLGMVLNYLAYPYKNVASLRYQIRNYSGWVYTNEIEYFLKSSKIPYKITKLSGEQDLINVLMSGGIGLVCINISYIEYGETNYIGRQYLGGTGHYVVISGYYKDDVRCYFEVLDPSNNEVRYYKSEEIMPAITTWWPWIFVFYKADQSVS